MAKKENKPEKLLVHCTAGLGWTGTFICLVNAMISIHF